MFGFDNLAEQMQRLEQLLVYADDSHREIDTVNLLVARNIPVTFAQPVSEMCSTWRNRPANPLAPAEETAATPAPSDHRKPGTRDATPETILRKFAPAKPAERSKARPPSAPA